MASEIVWPQSHVMSQETRETREPRSSDMMHSASDVRLPAVKKAKSSVYLRSSDRLYYENKNKNRYGKINEILGEVITEVVEPVDLLEVKQKVVEEPKLSFKRMPKIDYISKLVSQDTKREIFLAKFSIEAKNAGIADMHRYLQKQQEALDRQAKIARESEYLLKSFMKEESEKLRQLKELHLKMDEEKIQMGEKLTELKNSILDDDLEINRLTNEIQVIENNPELQRI